MYWERKLKIFNFIVEHLYSGLEYAGMECDEFKLDCSKIPSNEEQRGKMYDPFEFAAGFIKVPANLFPTKYETVVLIGDDLYFVSVTYTDKKE